ncbi:MAG: hypothetical protein ACOYNC_03670 [Bacteroidales bacterium]
MKKILYNLLFLSCFMLGTANLNTSFSQTAPEPPQPPGEHGGSGNKGAPLGDGVEMSLLLAALYGGYVVYKMRKREKTLS